MKNTKKYLLNIWKYLLLYLFLFICFLTPGYAIDVSFQWDPNNEPDLVGYRVFCREESQSYDYNNPSWEGTDIMCTIYDLDETKTYYFVSRAFDNYGLESIDSNELVLEADTTPDNQAPIADAGPDQTVNERQGVSLNGSNSTDPDDDIVSYHWLQIGEPVVNLSDPNLEQPTFTAPDVGPEGAALTFELTVIDQGENQAKDTCVVNVTWENEPPQANAGMDQTVDEEIVVTLDGSFSLDIDDGIESYSWNQISGPAVILSNPALSQPTFLAPDVGPEGTSLTFNLTVTDSGGLKNTDSCIVNISWQNEPPAAVVTPNYMETTEETLVTLDGSASTDPDDGIASYSWTQVDGDPVSLSNNTSALTTFIAPKTDSLGKNVKLKLTVKDHGGLQGTADSSIYVIQNELPTLNSVAITGATQVNEGSGEQYTLTANYSDGSTANVTSSASWSANSQYASISSSGYLTTSPVTSDQSCSITATYEDKSDIHSIMIKDVPPTLNSVAITGATQVNEGSGEQYTLTANYSDGSTANVTSSASWSANSQYASISSSSGYLTTSPVTSDQSCSITATYEGKSDIHSIMIKDVPPTKLPDVDFSYDSKKKLILFTDRSDGTIVSWFWNFGDGDTSTEQNPSHRYRKIGDYPVTLTVTDNGGASNQISKKITVTK